MPAGALDAAAACGVSSSILSVTCAAPKSKERHNISMIVQGLHKCAHVCVCVGVCHLRYVLINTVYAGVFHTSIYSSGLILLLLLLLLKLLHQRLPSHLQRLLSRSATKRGETITIISSSISEKYTCIFASKSAARHTHTHGPAHAYTAHTRTHELTDSQP